jgi:hypothetical protein
MKYVSKYVLKKETSFQFALACWAWSQSINNEMYGCSLQQETSHPHLIQPQCIGSDLSAPKGQPFSFCKQSTAGKTFPWPKNDTLEHVLFRIVGLNLMASTSPGPMMPPSKEHTHGGHMADAQKSHPSSSQHTEFRSSCNVLEYQGSSQVRVKTIVWIFRSCFLYFFSHFCIIQKIR